MIDWLWNLPPSLGTVLAAGLTGAGVYLAARMTRETAEEAGRREANAETMRFGSSLRDELRAEIARLQGKLERLERDLDIKAREVDRLREELAREKGHREAIERMWCDNPNCNVFRGRPKPWDGTERRKATEGDEG